MTHIYFITPYRQGPGDKGDFQLDAKQDDKKEDGGEDPKSDSNKHHPSVRWHHSVTGAGYQCPVDHPQELERGQRENKTDQLRRDR